MKLMDSRLTGHYSSERTEKKVRGSFWINNELVVLNEPRFLLTSRVETSPSTLLAAIIWAGSCQPLLNDVKVHQSAPLAPSSTLLVSLSLSLFFSLTSSSYTDETIESVEGGVFRIHPNALACLGPLQSCLVLITADHRRGSSGGEFKSATFLFFLFSPFDIWLDGQKERGHWSNQLS